MYVYPYFNNKTFFKKYLFGRRFVIILMFISIASFMISYWTGNYLFEKKIIFSITIIAIILLFVFEVLARPFFIKITVTKEDTSLQLYAPKKQFYRSLNTENIIIQKIKPSDFLSYKLEPKGSKRYLVFIIKKANGEIIKLKKLNFSWATEKGFKELDALIDFHNNPYFP